MWVSVGRRGRPKKKGTAIMKLMTMTQVTVDGVMQGNGGASDEDRRNGFERGGWALGMGDNETMTFMNQTYQRADAFLFGRRTYELFAGYWQRSGLAPRRKIRAATRSQLPLCRTWPTGLPGYHPSPHHAEYRFRCTLPALRRMHLVTGRAGPPVRST
jgi:hypothetical protein